MTDSFVKLYGTILDSSIWAETHPTRIVWITMLAMADADGIVRASTGGLAHRARVTKAELVEALEVLSGPDADSRDGTDGARLLRLPDPGGGWAILNHGRYRDKRTRSQVKTAERVAKWREAQKQKDLPGVTGVTGVTGNDVTTEADPEADPDLLDGNAAARSAARESSGDGSEAAAASSEKVPGGDSFAPNPRVILWAFADAWAKTHPGERPDASDSNLKRAAKVCDWLATLPVDERARALEESVNGAASRIKNAERPIAVWAADPGSFRSTAVSLAEVVAEVAALREEDEDLEGRMRYESREKILEPMRERRAEIRTKLTELGHG